MKQRRDLRSGDYLSNSKRFSMSIGKLFAGALASSLFILGACSNVGSRDDCHSGNGATTSGCDNTNAAGASGAATPVSPH
jgi:hypothetical protein